MPSTPSTPIDLERRARTAAAAADAIAGADLASFPSLVGFDGFIDSITRLVGSRRTMAMQDFTPISTISEFGGRVLDAAGRSTNIEAVLVEDRFGGNGPLYAGALGTLGLPVTYIGAVGSQGPGSEVLPVFKPFAKLCREVVTLGRPSSTLCLEFEDGKVMINDRGNVQAVTWDVLGTQPGHGRLREIVSGSRLVCVVNWSLMAGVQGIFEGLAGIVPKTGVRIFVDLSDLTPRSDTDVRRCLDTLGTLDRASSSLLTLGLNLAEAACLSRVLGLDPLEGSPPPEQLVRSARAIRAKAGVSCVVIHPREGAAGATATDTAWFDGPLCARPKLSTGAGDHFNAGFSVAQCLGLPLDQCLAAGTALSGAYVRDAASPTRDRLVSFLRNLPISD